MYVIYSPDRILYLSNIVFRHLVYSHERTDTRLIDLKYIPRHVELKVGDTIVTSGYNSVFPEGIVIGTINSFKLNEEAQFHTIKVALSQDFGKLSFVEVVKSHLKAEKDVIEVRGNTNMNTL